MTLGEKILKHREKACMSKEEFAMLLGLEDSSRIEQWENDSSAPDVLLLDEMTNIFEAPKDWYIEKEDVSFHEFLDEVLDIRELVTYIAFHGDRHFFQEASKTLREIKTQVIQINKEKKEKAE
jgi:transcriptional regulator with XRE-family HTH domain